ncbi:MAG: hypothetical protein ACFFCC_01535 [Promethearchaeota archaeon]
MEKNIEITSQYYDFIQSIILIFKMNILLKQKENLIRELEIYEQFKQTSDIKASRNLLQKLSESLENNKKRLRYLKEDYYKQKAHYDQITEQLTEYESNIQELTNLKKQCFSHINKITREMSGNSTVIKESLAEIKGIDDNSTNAQKIRALQKKAKEAQIEIRELNSKIGEINLKYEEFKPIYQSYKDDYENLIKIINSDTSKIEDLQLRINEEIKKSDTVSLEKYNAIDLNSIRTSQEIEVDLKNTTSELNSIIIPNNYIDSNNPEDLSLSIKYLNQISNTLKALENDISLSVEKSDLDEIFESFQKLERILLDLEIIINGFLAEINLEIKFQILLSSDNKTFNIQLLFTRTNNNSLNFDELTTPEKIFFIIVWYISTEIQLNSKNIIFSNLFIPSIYNKAGSIFRTIRKILPLFESEKLPHVNLIFILSNLEMKKDIKNLEIITIQESE